MGGTKVLLIYTGGTIGMIKDLETRVLKPFDFEQIKKDQKKARGIKIVKEPKYLRHFTSHFKFI